MKKVPLKMDTPENYLEGEGGGEYFGLGRRPSRYGETPAAAMRQKCGDVEGEEAVEILTGLCTSTRAHQPLEGDPMPPAGGLAPKGTSGGSEQSAGHSTSPPRLTGPHPTRSLACTASPSRPISGFDVTITGDRGVTDLFGLDSVAFAASAGPLGFFPDFVDPSSLLLGRGGYLNLFLGGVCLKFLGGGNLTLGRYLKFGGGVPKIWGGGT